MDAWERFGMTALAAALLIGAAALGMVARSDGAVDYCYVETRSAEGVPHVYVTLHGHRPWRIDAKLGIFDTFDLAVDGAERAKCPLHK